MKPITFKYRVATSLRMQLTREQTAVYISSASEAISARHLRSIFWVVAPVECSSEEINHGTPTPVCIFTLRENAARSKRLQKPHR